MRKGQTDQLLSPTTVARMLGCSEATVRNYVAAGRLPAVAVDNGRRVFWRSAVENFAAARHEVRA